MTKTSSTASKLFVGFVATAMLFTLSYTPAKAATAAELQAQIDALLAQIAGMTTGGSTSSSCAQFTTDLTLGSSGADVTALQKFLIGKGYAIAAGATGYFGGQTQAALASMQAAVGISPAAGYFGPMTRAKVNGMCTTAGGDDEGSDDEGSDDEDDSSSEDLSGEASLDDVTANDGDDTSIEEGQEDAPVAEFDVEFADGDAKITRIDLGLVAVTSSEEDAWDTFEEISLWVDGEEVAREDASDEDEYLDEDDGTIRFSGLDIVAMEDEEVTITVGVTTQGSIDNLSATWRVDMEAIRFMDADDVSTTEDAVGDMGTGNGTSFDIDVEGADDEIIVKASSEDPDATTIAVEESEKSDWTTIFAFDLDTDDSTNDIEVNTLKVGVVTDTDVVEQVVSDIQLVIDGETYDDVTWTTSNTATATASFDIDGDLVIEAGERATVEVQVEFKAQSGNYDEGDTIYATSTGSYGDFEGADDVTGEGSATGETHTLRTQGAILEAGDMTEAYVENDDTSTTDNEGTFTIKFDVTAFETDLYIDDTAASSTTMGTVGANFLVTKDGSVAVTSALAAALTSTAELEGGRYKVAEGETETFTLSVEIDPSAAGFHKVQLYSVNWNDSNGAPDTQQLALPAEDYETDPLNI